MKVSWFEDKNFENKFYRIICVLSLIGHFYYISYGWNLPLLDIHAFRQTQTALTTYWIVQEGFRLDYITPVKGPPWSIPLEFPLYQWIVAAFHKLTNYSLDQAGRLVSLVFFYATLYPTFLFAKNFWKDERFAFLLISLVVLNPIYIFWSRSFMIETTVLCFSAYFIWFFNQAIQLKKFTYYTLAIGFGILAGLVKPTTYAVYLVAAFIIYCEYAWLNGVNWKQRDWERYLIKGAFLTLPSIVGIWFWTRFSDQIKASRPNPDLVSSSMHGWNFGTFEQRLEIDLWQSWVFEFNGIFQIINSFDSGIVTAISLVSIILLGVNAKTQKRILLFSIIVFFSGPLVFFNLYRHDYYQSAITIWFCFFVTGILIHYLFKDSISRYVKYFTVSVFFSVYFLGYTNTNYFAAQQKNLDYYKSAFQIFEYIKKNATPETDTLLAFDLDWTSVYAYYTGLKTNMDHSSDLNYLMSSKFQNYVDALETEKMKVKAVLFGREPSNDAIGFLVNKFGTKGMRSKLNGHILIIDYEDNN